MPETTFADYVRRTITRAPLREGPTDLLLESRLRTFGDDDKVQLYAGDVRGALMAARFRKEPKLAYPPERRTIREAVRLLLLACAWRVYARH